jgi:hypothetical protein
MKKFNSKRPSYRRLSKSEMDKLSRMFDEFSQTIQSVSKEMDIEVDRVVELWNAKLRAISSDGPGRKKLNYFPIFQKYYKALLQQRMESNNTHVNGSSVPAQPSHETVPDSPLSDNKGDTDSSWNKQCSEAFLQFQRENSDWMEILDSFNEALLYETVGKTGQRYRNRQKEFYRVRDSLQRIVSIKDWCYFDDTH